MFGRGKTSLLCGVEHFTGGVQNPDHWLHLGEMDSDSDSIAIAANRLTLNGGSISESDQEGE